MPHWFSKLHYKLFTSSNLHSVKTVKKCYTKLYKHYSSLDYETSIVKEKKCLN